MQSGRVLKQLLPGLGLRASILTKATAAGTDFGKVCGERVGCAWVGRWVGEQWRVGGCRSCWGGGSWAKLLLFFLVLAFVRFVCKLS